MQLLNCSSWEVTWPGGTLIHHTGILRSLSAGKTPALSRTYTCLHDSGAASRHPVVPLDNHYEIHSELNFFFRSLHPGAENSFEMQSALPGSQKGTRGSTPCSKGRSARLGAAEQLHIHGRAHNQSKILQIWVIPRQASAKTTPLCSRQRAETHQERRAIAIGCHGSVHG